MRPGFFWAMVVFVAVASAALTTYLVVQNRHINALLLFALIFFGVIGGTVYAFVKAGRHREFFDATREAFQKKPDAEED